nr:MAG TPA: hypothetical protein [Caudoviricetes sp.]
MHTFNNLIINVYVIIINTFINFTIYFYYDII